MEHFQVEAENLKLEHAMMAELGTRKIVSKELVMLLRMTSTFVEVLLKDCPWEEKINLALYTWVMFYADSPKNLQPLLEFQSRFFHGQTQLDPILDMLADILHKMHDQYPPLSIHFLVTATFEYLAINCVEPQLQALNDAASASESESNMPVMKPLANLTRFAGFLRDKSGLGVVMALAAYPNSRKVDFATLVQTLPDMGFWVTACNDALSFYKEELEGEATAYIPSRARAENRSAVQVLESVVNEMLEASENIERALMDRDLEALKTWKTVERGFM
ncbi:hypothetical protein H0H93_015482 [Arthromyces matolae]|nr:hypothetical protein H0H93_015482 [Arthromyces matolae]